MSNKLIPILLILALGLTACSFTITLPETITPGPTVTDTIAIPVPEGAGTANLTLGFGAGELHIAPGGEQLVSGTATYNISPFKPEITVSGEDVRLEQGDWDHIGIPNWDHYINRWDLSLGTTPMNLHIQAGAYQAVYEFGGLALTSLTIQDGAADVDLSFASPNLVEMSTLRYETGASSVSLTGLANANFAMLEFDGGAGDYTLDFSGQLQRDASVTIEIGVSNMTLVIPEGIPVRITIEGGLSNVSHGSGWTQSGNVYTQDGSGPTLTIVLEMGAGNLNLTR